MKIYCGIDWAEAHHDVAVIDDTGQRLAKARISDDLRGFAALCELLAEVAGLAAGAEPSPVGGAFIPVDIAIETDRGLLVAALRAAGHRIWSINPKAVDRYRDRYSGSRAKSDPGDALLLANALRTDGHAHRQLPADSDLAGAVGVLARTQQDLARRRRSEAQAVRSLLREFFPAALLAFPDLTTAMALVVLTAAPTPAAAAALTEEQIVDLLREAGHGTLPKQAARLGEIFAAAQLRQPAPVETAMGQALVALVAALRGTVRAIRNLEVALQSAWEEHPQAPVLGSCRGWAWCWLPACWRSSVTTPRASRAPRVAGRTPAQPRSPGPPARATPSCCDAAATAAWSTPAGSGPTARSPSARARGRTTTDVAPRATGTRPHCATSRTSSSGNSITADVTAAPTAKSRPGPRPKRRRRRCPPGRPDPRALPLRAATAAATVAP